MRRKGFLATLFGSLFFTSEALAKMDVVISIKGDGSALKGVVPVTVTASPTRNIQRVELFVNDVLLGSQPTVPAEFSWDTTNLPDAAYTLFAKVFYKQRISTASISVWTANQGAPPPPPPPPPSEEWTHIANENESFTLAEPGEVRYGKDTTWTVKTFAAGTYACSNAVFGDPLVGTVKECQLHVGVTPPPPPPPSGYPASYFVGPLGQLNPVPPKTGAFLIAWPGIPGGATTWEQYKANVLKRESDMGRKYDGLMIGDNPIYNEWAEQRMEWINAHGSIPIVAGKDFGDVSVVASGGRDSAIDAEGAHYASLGFVVMIRLMHEFNYAGPPYTSVGKQATWVAAWRRIVDRFKARGATNVGWWWCPAEGSGDQTREQDFQSYPGDDYVDWVGSDSYNHCYVNAGSCYATPWEPGWASFGKVFDYSETAPWDPNIIARTKHNTYGPRKPFVVGETGTRFDSSYPTYKGQWYRDIPAALQNMEYCRGVAFFDQDVQIWEPGNNWLVDYPTNVPSVYDGWKAMAADPYFNTRT